MQISNRCQHLVTFSTIKNRVR